MSPETPLLDAVTGTYSRASWEHLVEAELSRARRYGDPLTLALVQVQASASQEAALHDVAGRLLERCRKEDILGRFNDDTFALLAVTMTGEPLSLVEALYESCEGFEIVAAAVLHRATRPFTATIRDAESALATEIRTHRRASA